MNWRLYLAFLVSYLLALYCVGFGAALAVFGVYVGFLWGGRRAYGRGLKHGGALWQLVYLQYVEDSMSGKLAPSDPRRARIARDIASVAKELPRGTVIEMQKAAHEGRPKTGG